MTTNETTSSVVTNTWKLLVIGGWVGGGHYTSDVEKVDPNKKSSKCEKPMRYPTAINWNTAQAFPDQLVLSCGGSNGHQDPKSCYEYNPIYSNWSYATDMIYDRRWTSSVLLNDDELWLVGGNVPSCQTTEIYDRKTKSFRRGPDTPVQIYRHCITKLNATHVFIGGGRSIDQSWYYDTSFLVDIREEPFVFNMLPKMDKSRWGAGCGVIRFDSKNGNMNQGYTTSSSKQLIIMAGGGDHDKDVAGNARRDSEIFNIEENSWSTGPMIPRAFMNGGSASLGDGSIVLVGGYDENFNSKSDIIRLNPSLMEFETMSGEIEIARVYFGMAVLLDNEDC